MSKQRSIGTCCLCQQKIAKQSITKHLKTCTQAVLANASPSWDLQDGPSFHLFVEAPYAKAYWMHLAVPLRTTLSKLDQFLRKTWLECCGHLSAFEIEGEQYGTAPEGGERSMRAPLERLLDEGTKFSYQYDFGSTTELVLKVVGVAEQGTPQGRVLLLARNEPPQITCEICEARPAVEICPECMWDEAGLLCEQCAEEHECDPDMRLPVVNSPRMGVCAYTG